MFDPLFFHEVVSGRRKGPSAIALRGLLSAAEPVVALGIRIRNWRYATKRAGIYQVGVPVVSVGNITVGGTGKTPLVEWIARWLRRRNVRVTLISRGYGAPRGAVNDEALELEQKLVDVPHLQNPNRVEAARTAIDELDSQFLLLDDAFQHRRLDRDLDIVLIDALNPFGYGHVFPRGLLREPLAGLSRADVVVLSRADMIDEPRRRDIQKTVRRYAPQAPWLECRHVPVRLQAFDGKEDAEPGQALAGREVAAFCGIGNPAGFRHTLKSAGCRLTDFRVFPDHHPYRREDIESLQYWANQQHDASSVICTHKDLVKIGLARLGSKPLWALVIGIEFLADPRELESQLGALLGALLPRQSR